MKKFKLLFVLIFMGSYMSQAQCDPTVPLYIIDLSTNPDTTWTLFEEDALERDGSCCSADPNENCIQFLITLHPNSAGVFFDYDGAGAFGSLNWQVDCGPEYDLNDTICLTGGSTFTLTFCKPGSDNGNYTLISVAEPSFPVDQFIPLNCSQPVEAFGVTENSIVWQSISPGAPGDYDNLLDCTDCLSPVYTPDPNGPLEVEYQVCGYPILDYCVGELDFCDTVKFTSLDSILLNVTPANPSFCSEGSIQLTANATGGDGNFTYYWYDNLAQIGTGPTLDVNVAGTYTCEVRDGNFQLFHCDNFSTTISVVETVPPIVVAGADQVLCGDEPLSYHVGSVQFANGGIWSGGNGTYSPSNTDLVMTYTPTTAEIASGSVTLTLTSTGAGVSCSDSSDDVQLFYLDTLQTDLVDIDLNCSSSTQVINPTISGGLAPFTFMWNDGTQTQDNTLGTGTHCLTINDANGCQATECLTITAPSTLYVSMSSTPESFPGNLDGTATANPSGGTPPYTYLWNTSGTNQTEVGLGYGIYTVTVTDNNGCTYDASVVVNQPSCGGYSISSSATDVLCNSDSSGTATVTMSGGIPPYAIIWNDYTSQTSPTAINLPSGVYEVIVTDGNGCIAVTTANVLEPSALQNTITHTNASVQGGSDGDAQANVIGGFGSYDYLWSTTENTQAISGLSTAWYNVVITDDNGCILEDSVFINEPPCDQFYIYTSTISPLCNGDLTGEALLNITNGTAPFNISWSTGEIDLMSISGMPAGIHSVEVTDAQGCYSLLSFGISEPTELSLGLITVPSSCFGSNNGTIDLSVVGGTYPYLYTWNTGLETEDLINLGPETYQVIVKDLNGCIDSIQTTLVDPSLLSILSSVQGVTCFDGTDGAIDVTTTGGTLPYTFDWSNGETTEDLSGIDIGGYILNVMDGNFCDLLNPSAIIVAQPDVVEALIINTNCPIPGATQTQVDIIPIGGNADYAISEDGGATYNPYLNYSVSLDVNQTHNILVKDVNGCLSAIYSIDIDSNVAISDVSFNPCYTVGQIDEAITVITTGGTPNYSISSDNGNTFNAEGVYTFSVPIDAGYQLIATDSLGCVSEPYTITLPAIFTTIASVTSDYNGVEVSCNGLSDAAMTANPSGGTIGYTYSWDTNPSTGVFSTSQSPSGIAAGDYMVSVQDTNGCISTELITVTEPSSLGSTIAVTSDYNGEDVSCYSSTNGSSEITPLGGVGPYTVTWSNTQTGVTAIGLGAGTYSAIILDANNCQTSNSITLTQPDTLDISSTIIDVFCFQGNNGNIDITPSGGVMPYTYTWSNTETTQDISNLIVGQYSVIMEDANNCIYIYMDTVNEPTDIVLDLTPTNTSCFNYSDGTMDLTASGGTLPYTYLWNYNSVIAEDLINVPAGNYSVTITDSNNCTHTITGTITEPDSLTLDAILTNALCYNDDNGSIDITVTGGTNPYVFNWSNGGLSEDITDLTDGTYTVSILDSMNCSQFGTYIITEPDSLIVELTSPLNFHNHHISLYGLSDGSIDATITGGTQPYNYLWSNGEITEDLSGVSAGLYIIDVIDMNGCKATNSISLIQPMDLELPSAFSPNEDGANDSYVIHGIDAYPDNTITVLNRWGNVVYEEEGYQNTWQGTSQNGEPLPDAVYFFILEINSGEIKKDTYVHIKTY